MKISVLYGIDSSGNKNSDGFSLSAEASIRMQVYCDAAMTCNCSFYKVSRVTKVNTLNTSVADKGYESLICCISSMASGAVR